MGEHVNDVLVIGAGVGGLAAAIRLASEGRSVRVLEAQSYPGGKMRVLPSTAGPIDAGPTVLTLRHVFDTLFEAAGARLEDYITLHREAVLARHFWPDGSSLDLFADPEQSADAVRGLSGETDAQAFQVFSQQAAELFRLFDGPMMRTPHPALGSLALKTLRKRQLLPMLLPWARLASKLARRFEDPRLQQLFGRYATYVGGSPYACPALLSLIWHAEAQGVWRVEGGMGRLASALAALAQKSGVTIVFDTPVAEIELQSGRATAVLTRSGERHAARQILFNGDPRALYSGLLGDAAQRAVPGRAVTPRSLSANVWAFAAEPIGAKLAHHTVFFGSDPRLEFEPLSRGQSAQDPALYVCAQDHGRASPGVQRFEIIMNAPPLPGGQPEERELCKRKTFDSLAARGLRFSPEPELSALTTPQGFETLFPGSQGSLYGRSPHGMMAALLRPKGHSRIPGLYLAGGGVHPGAGLPMAALSGLHAAETILSDQTSTSKSRRTAMPGGTSMRSPKTGPARSQSSPS